MKRFDGWEGLLDAFVESRKGSRFCWGVNDCCLFACDAVLAMTGEDLARGFRETYATAKQARKALRQLGIETVGQLAECRARDFGLREVPPPFAQRGDVVLLDRDLGESLGIVSLAGTEVLAPGEERLAEVAFHAALRAWRI